ncbi:kinesin family member 26 [Paragonimus westermani]|uniref:Kinesin family member 26 n=1 Tax=Paragonimus westermani TaxID=34504 RepID=A0A5J4P1D4_9TREM|nr:kinesin family member 26 [Paragonimus westermani]
MLYYQDTKDIGRELQCNQHGMSRKPVIARPDVDINFVHCHFAGFDEINTKPIVTTSGLTLAANGSYYNFARLLRNEHPELPKQLAIIEDNGENNQTLKGIPPINHQHSIGSHGSTGKVKVILCVHQFSCDHHLTATTSDATQNYDHAHVERGQVTSVPATQYISVDVCRNQITLVDPTPIRRLSGLSRSKLFTFDAVLTRAEPMVDLCAVALRDAIRAVLRGQDGCVLAIGHKQTGKTFSMLGMDNSPQNVGIIPCAISWLFRLLNQQQQTGGTRFSVRVSAVELHGPDESLRDLLANVVTSAEERLSPSQYLQPTTERANGQRSNTVRMESDGRNVGSVATRIAKQLAQQSELQASTAEKAAQLLDIALSNRAHVINESESGLSHMLFTLHVYQCRVARGENGTSVSGGRTRLHLFDLGCGRYSHQASGVSTTVRLGNKYSKRTSKHDKSHSKTHSSSEDSFIGTDDFDKGTTGTQISTKCLSMSGLANVLLALLTGQRYLPFRDSALTHLLKEAMTGNQMHPCIVAHIASGEQYYTETLQVIQLVSKLSRLRRRRVGPSVLAANTLNSSLTSDQQTLAGSRDEAGSSSMDGFSEAGRTNPCYRRFRGPRLGRSSYYSRSVTSFNSELDFTSSSEQSCDTVIYLGHGVQAHGTRTDGSANPLISKLGPRGMADGSVDARSASSGHLSAGELSTIPHNDSVQKKQQLPETVTFSSLAWQAKNGIELAMNNVSHTEPACDYTVLNHDSKRGPRALSDISERTEDTETVPDCGTLKSNSSNDLIDCLSVMNLETLSYPDISHAKYGYRTVNGKENQWILFCSFNF